MRILLVEDHVRFARSLEQGLREESIEVVHALDGGHALERVARGDLDLIVLDLGLPDLDGIDVLSELRRSAGHVPVLVLTARDSVESRVQALELGADDYLVKPFAFAELVARIRALSRRAAGPRWAPRLEGVLTFDDENGVHFAGQRVMLSPREHALLAYLLRRRGEVVPRCDILREVFGCIADPGTNALDVHLTHLRRKLSGAAVSLETVRGVGIRARLEAE